MTSDAEVKWVSGMGPQLFSEEGRRGQVPVGVIRRASC